MTNSTMRWMMTAAALVVAAGSASAQSYKTNIPMSFRVGETLMQPGAYEIRIARNGVAEVHVYNYVTRKSAVVIPRGSSDAHRTWVKAGKPVLAFECIHDACSLSQLWDGTNQFAYNLPTRKLPAAEARNKETVTVAITKSR